MSRRTNWKKKRKWKNGNYFGWRFCERYLRMGDWRSGKGNLGGGAGEASIPGSNCRRRRRKLRKGGREIPPRLSCSPTICGRTRTSTTSSSIRFDSIACCSTSEIAGTTTDDGARMNWNGLTSSVLFCACTSGYKFLVHKCLLAVCTRFRTRSVPFLLSNYTYTLLFNTDIIVIPLKWI